MDAKSTSRRRCQKRRRLLQARSRSPQGKAASERHSCESRRALENASYRESEMMVFWWEGEAQVSKDTYGCDGSPTLCFLLAQLSWLITSPCFSRLVFSHRRKTQPGDRDDRSSLLLFASHHRPLRPPNSRTMQHVVLNARSGCRSGFPRVCS